MEEQKLDDEAVTKLTALLFPLTQGEEHLIKLGELRYAIAIGTHPHCLAAIFDAPSWKWLCEWAAMRRLEPKLSTSRGYVSIGRNAVARLLVGATRNSQTVLHRNGNYLDLRRSNLRYLSYFAFRDATAPTAAPPKGPGKDTLGRRLAPGRMSPVERLEQLFKNQ